MNPLQSSTSYSLQAKNVAGFSKRLLSSDGKASRTFQTYPSTCTYSSTWQGFGVGKAMFVGSVYSKSTVKVFEGIPVLQYME